MENIDKHICNTCNKEYSSYSSLWNHNKNIHKNNIKNVINNINIVNENVKKNNKSLTCEYCNKVFNNRPSKSIHKKICQVIFDGKEKQNNEINTNELKIAEINSNEKIKLAEINKEIKLAEINKEIELKKLEIKKENSLIKKEEKIHSNPTIKKINKLLQNKINMTNSNLTSNSHNTTNVQNIVHNHFKIESFGKENILDIISDKEKKLIINQGYESIEKLIEITNTGNYDQLKNIVITNKRDNYAYIYDEKTGIFISCDKNVALCKLVTNRLYDIEEIYNDFDEKNKISDKTRKILSAFFMRMSVEDKPFIDENSNNKEYKNYLDFQVDKVKNILFNNQDKILKDVTLAIDIDKQNDNK